jgi:hypothetical protein
MEGKTGPDTCKSLSGRMLKSQNPAFHIIGYQTKHVLFKLIFALGRFD